MSTAGVTALNLASPMANALQLRCDPNSPYKALVGINLNGGNDGFNCFIPKNNNEYQKYSELRTNLAWNQSDVLDLSLDDNGLNLGLSPELSDLKWMFDQGKALPIVNVGPLMQPRSSGDEIDDLRPIHLFSHNHQSQITQTKTTHYISNEGWGALSAHLLSDSFNMEELTPLFETGSHTTWTNSLPKSANRIGTSLPPNMSFPSMSQNLYDAFRQHSETKDSVFKEYYAELCYDANLKYEEFSKIFNNEETYGFNLDSDVGKQLRVVFLLLLARDSFKKPTQFFSVTLGGFDTHSNQKNVQGALLRDLSSQLSIFYERLEEHGLSEAVTTFTMSEFGRTLEPNGTGTDHGWGNCHWVLGGDLLGNRIVGDWPDLKHNSHDMMTRGRIVPTMSVDLFHATLLQWLGVRESDLNYLFPSLGDQKSLPIFRSCDSGDSQNLTITNAIATAENPNGIDKVEHAIDGNMNTKWSAFNDCQYTVELQSIFSLDEVRFAQAKGDERSYLIDIEVSRDGINFDHVLSITTDGNSNDLVKYPLGSIKGRFIRFVCLGNNDQDISMQGWNNFKQIEVWGS
ncbi:DUF1501 domain-containing protein [Vibrio inusitatus]